MRFNRCHTTVLSIALVTAAAIVLVGCGANRQFRANGLPGRHYLVGGGMEIAWTAPARGTAYWVEENTCKIVQTKYLEEGGEFYMSNVDPEEFKKAMGIATGDARLALYFVPSD
jgi:hypothetical protein